jgi:DNA-binding GntR family transcriptional regulator
MGEPKRKNRRALGAGSSGTSDRAYNPAMSDGNGADQPAKPPEVTFASMVSRHERRFQTVGDMVYNVLRDGIFQGVFPPGEYLRQDYLADTIGVSRIPVRSALMQLESEGLVTFHPYRGALVSQLSAAEMREIYEMRVLLETAAMRKGFAEMTPERLETLEVAARELNEIEDGTEFLHKRNDFFRLLYDGEHHPRLVSTIERLREDAGRYWLQRRKHHGYVRPPGDRDHQEVLRFLKTGDVDGAVKWLQNHLERVAHDLLALMEEEQEPAATAR